jgi:hypothetical protein
MLNANNPDLRDVFRGIYTGVVNREEIGETEAANDLNWFLGYARTYSKSAAAEVVQEAVRDDADIISRLFLECVSLGAETPEDVDGTEREDLLKRFLKTRKELFKTVENGYDLDEFK